MRLNTENPLIFVLLVALTLFLSSISNRYFTSPIKDENIMLKRKCDSLVNGEYIKALRRENETNKIYVRMDSTYIAYTVGEINRNMFIIDSLDRLIFDLQQNKKPKQ